MATLSPRLNQERPISHQTMSRWFVVVGGMLTTMALGTFYALSVFTLPLEKEFGWTRTQTSLVTTFATVMISFWFLVAGVLQDRKGPRIPAAIGGIFFSLAFFLASEIHALLTYYLTIGVFAGAGIGFGYVASMAAGSKWFPDKRGLVIGLMVGGSGAGSGLFGPLASSLIDRVGWRSTFRVLSAIFFVMTMVGTYLLKGPPPGYRPSGWDTSRVNEASPRSADVPPSQMVRTRTFWSLWIAYCLGTIAGLMVISQLVPFARASGHTAAIAAFAITVGALGNACGRIFSGWMSDHAGRLNTLRIALLISAIAMPVLFLVRENVAFFYLLLFVVYYCYGTQFSVYVSTSADFYGTKSLGINYGLLFTAWGVAGLFGPFLGGRVYVATGEYRWAFFVAAAVSLAAIGLLFLAETPEGAKPR